MQEEQTAKRREGLSKNYNLLNPAQIADIKARIKGIDQFLATHAQSPFKRVREADETYARQEKRRLQRQLEDRSPKQVGETERDKMYRRVKYLETKIKEGMPTRDEMMGKRVTVDGNPNKKGQEAVPSTVRKHLAWQASNAVRIKEWKHLKRILEPENPDATNVETLRKIH